MYKDTQVSLMVIGQGIVLLSVTSHCIACEYSQKLTVKTKEKLIKVKERKGGVGKERGAGGGQRLDKDIGKELNSSNCLSLFERLELI